LLLLSLSSVELLAQDVSVEGAAPAKSISELRARRNAELATQSMDPKVKETWNRYISTPVGEHDPADLMRLQASWDQIQAAAHRGEIPPEQNSRFLQDHGKDMKARLERAGAAEGLTATVQTPSGPQKNYSDSDGHLRAREGGEMTPEQIRNVRQRFNEEFNRDLRAAGEPELKNPAAKMRTDGMPVTDDPKLFERAKQIINPEGGLMYGSHDAVKQEIANREGAGGETLLEEKVAHGQEQIRQIRSHQKEAARKIEEGRALVDNNPLDSPEHRRGLRLLEEAHGEGASAGGKYEARLGKTTNAVAEQTGGERHETGGKRAEALDKVNKTRDVTVNKESSTLGSSYENEIYNKQRTNVKNLAASGNLPEAAEMARNATPNQRGQLIEEARGAILEREAAALRASGSGLDEAEIQSIARQRADRQTAQLAEEMRRNSTPDRWNPSENQWELNSTYEKPGTAGGRGARPGAPVDPSDALGGPGKGRPSWDTGPSEVAVIGPDAKVKPIDGRSTPKAAPKAGPNYLGAFADGADIGGQLLERSSRQMGQAVDENRDLNLGDAAEIGADMVPGVAGYKGSQQALLDRQVQRLQRQDRIGQLEAKAERSLDEDLELVRLRHAEAANPDTALGSATSMAKEGVAGYFDEMKARAKQEGRASPEFLRDGLPMLGRMARDLVNAVNPINQTGSPLVEGAYEQSTLDERADWAGQKVEMTAYVTRKAMSADKRNRAMVSELDRMLANEDMSDPANQQRAQALLSDIEANQKEIKKMVALADGHLGEVDPAELGALRGIARSQPSVDALRDYAKQMQGDAKPSGGEAAANPADPSGDAGWGEAKAGFTANHGSESAWGEGGFEESAVASDPRIGQIVQLSQRCSYREAHALASQVLESDSENAWVKSNYPAIRDWAQREQTYNKAIAAAHRAVQAGDRDGAVSSLKLAMENAASQCQQDARVRQLLDQALALRDTDARQAAIERAKQEGKSRSTVVAPTYSTSTAQPRSRSEDNEALVNSLTDLLTTMNRGSGGSRTSGGSSTNPNDIYRDRNTQRWDDAAKIKSHADPAVSLPKGYQPSRPSVSAPPVRRSAPAARSAGAGQGGFSVDTSARRAPAASKPQLWNCNAGGQGCRYDDGWHDNKGRVFATQEEMRRANGWR
jgi:hypothetical protein